MKKGMAGQKWGPDVMAHPAEEFSESSERGKFCQHAWRAYWQCGGVLLKGPESSGAYGEITTWICGPCSCTHSREILPDIQTNARRKRFLGTKRLWNRRNARIIPPLLWRYKRRKCGRFGPPSPMEGGPRRTRRLRQQPQFGTRDTHVPIPCESEAFTKFCRLTPSGKAGVKPSSDGGGGRLFAALLPFANSLRLSKEELSCKLPRSR